MSRGLAAFVAGMGGGYLKADRQRQEDERTDKLDKMREEEFSLRKTQAAQQDEIYQAGRTEREEKAAVKNAMAQSNQAGQIEDVATANYTDASGQQKSAYQPDAATAKVALEQQAMEEGKPMPGMEGNTASVGAATSVKRMDGSRALYTGFDGAAKAKAYADENQPGSYAAYSSLEKRLRALPLGEEAADKTLLRAKLADKEGVFRAMTLAQNGDFAEAKKSYNSSGMRRLTDSQELQFGADGKTVQVFDKGSGQVLVPDVNQKLIAYLGGAEGAVAQAKARADAVAKYEEKLLEPYTLKPGEKRQVFDRTTGKTVTIGEGAIPKGYELVTDQSGNTLLRAMDPRGSGAGSGSAGGGGKAVDPYKGVDEQIEFVIKESVAKGTLDPTAVAQIRTLGRQLKASAATDGRNLDDAAAGEIAIGVGTGKLVPAPAFNPRSNTIDNVVDYKGNKFSVESFGSPVDSRLAPEKMAAVASGFINQIPEGRRPLMVAAAYNPVARAKLNALLAEDARLPANMSKLEAKLGRTPTEADIAKTSAAAAAQIEPSLNLISRWSTRTDDGKELVKKMLKEAGYTSDGKGELPKKDTPPAGGAPRIQQPGGLGPRRTPAEFQKMVEAEKARIVSEKAEVGRAAAVTAQSLLASNDIAALAKFQTSAGFDTLDKATKTAIYKKVNGIQ